MLYLKNSRNGSAMEFATTVTISETDTEYVFDFFAERSTFNCPYQHYNEDHWEGDVCEVFIGDRRDPMRYFEIEVSPKGGLFFARIFNPGTGSDDLQVDLIANDMIRHSAEMIGNDYKATIAVNKTVLNLPVEEIVFNAFRIETDGEEMNKHLIALSPTMKEDEFHVTSAFVALKTYL